MKINEILEKYKITVKKSYGQNFLINKGILKIIINSSNINKEETIIEIGPGLGFLTEELVQNAKKVIAIEKDKTIIPYLNEKFKNSKNLEIIEADALEYEIKNKKYKVIANIPYYITSPLIRHFFNQKHRPNSITLLVQKEVAEKICEEKKLSILSLEVRLFSNAKIIKTVSKNSFFPAPKIDSAILHLTTLSPNDEKYISKENSEKIMQVAKIAFSNKRKQFFSTIQKKMKLSNKEIEQLIEKTKVNEKIRPEDLSIKELQTIANLLL